MRRQTGDPAIRRRSPSTSREIQQLSAVDLKEFPAHACCDRELSRRVEFWTCPLPKIPVSTHHAGRLVVPISS